MRTNTPWRYWANLTRVTLVAVGLFATVSATAGSGSSPCSTIQGAEGDRYTKLVDLSSKQYKKEDYLGAIESILELKSICSEDPRLDFNLARAYQRAGNCNMARYWFEHLLANAGKFSKPFLGDLPKLAGEALVELSSTCSNSAMVAFYCADKGVTIDLKPSGDGETLHFHHPFEGRVEAGDYLMAAHKEGYQSSVSTVFVYAGESNFISVPELASAEQRGTLEVFCPAQVESVTLSRVASKDSMIMKCGEPIALDSGNWRVDFAVGDYPFVEEVTVEQNRSIELHLTEPAYPGRASDDEVWATAALVTGSTAFVSGVLLLVLAEQMEVEKLRPTSVTPAGEVLAYSSAVDERKLGLRLSGGLLGSLGLVGIVTGVVLMMGEDESEEAALGFAPLADEGALFMLRGTF
ncbi:MAG: hypothetical protein CO108_13775 [Deltaproteobacteria bacterium CG_4_9_14_3_um_filter_63_12]|nr:MAG: hypothetical protein CO108_13775 [Deltaproteobacteria bacterium CG_4_9_14_3_um_filter_63_12]